MEQSKGEVKIYEQGCERYGLGQIIFGNAAMLVWIGLGAACCWFFHPIAAWAYLAASVLMVFVVLRRLVCVNCYYYGKLCAFGRGRLCPALFRRGNPQRFVDRVCSFRDVLPDLLVPAIPVVGGMVLLARDFALVLLLVVLAIAALATAGTGIVRGLLACPHCAQRELGCPAEQLFGRQRG